MTTAMTVLLSVATIVIAIVFATYAARACRGVHDVARSLGANGTDVRQIARRTGLQQDVVSMLLAPPTMTRQNLPVSAGTAIRTDGMRGRPLRAASRTPALLPQRAARAARGTDVAIA